MSVGHFREPFGDGDLNRKPRPARKALRMGWFGWREVARADEDEL